MAHVRENADFIGRPRPPGHVPAARLAARDCARRRPWHRHTRPATTVDHDVRRWSPRRQESSRPCRGGGADAPAGSRTTRRERSPPHTRAFPGCCPRCDVEQRLERNSSRVHPVLLDRRGRDRDDFEVLQVKRRLAAEGCARRAVGAPRRGHLSSSRAASSSAVARLRSVTSWKRT